MFKFLKQPSLSGNFPASTTWLSHRLEIGLLQLAKIRCSQSPSERSRRGKPSTLSALENRSLVSPFIPRTIISRQVTRRAKFDFGIVFMSTQRTVRNQLIVELV